MSMTFAKRAAAGQLDAEVADWLQRAMRDYLAGKASLEDALSLGRTARLRDCYKALADAARVLDPAGELRPWDLAGKLAAAIKRYELRTMPVWERAPTGELSPLNEAIGRAFAAGVRFPKTQRKLYDQLT